MNNERTPNPVQTLIVIPARYKSSRLPGKPLIQLLGKSMLLRTFERCLLAFPKENIIVATDDQRIADHCEEWGMPAIMTPSSCRTGTDRVAYVAGKISADFYVNVQGDEPVLNPDDLKAIVHAAIQSPNEVINGMCKIDSEELFFRTTIPKVVARPDGRLLYMSRGPIPMTKSGTFVDAKRQVCIYAFPKEALKDFASCPEKTPLEAIEDIEIIRFLEMGYEVRMVEVSDESIAIDVPEDVPLVEEVILKRGL